MKTVYEEIESLQSACDEVAYAAQCMALGDDGAVRDWERAKSRLREALEKRKTLIADLLELCEAHAPKSALECPAVLMARELGGYTYVV